MTRVFIDSSVLIAAAISAKGKARDLILSSLCGQFTLCLSDLVLDETERNRKAPAALTTFQLLREVLDVDVSVPSKSLVLRVANVVKLKDAPIVAGAIRARAEYLATYDRKHLLSPKEAIKMRFGIIAATPDDILDFTAR
ncbi:MAG: PIN domain-containing protein [Chloroflexi bacterium]|nr:PIN domain-containing protein [Chloroflexota bacterium]